MSPCLGDDCFNSVTIKLVNKGSKKGTLMFGVSKQHFAEDCYLGEMEHDWSMNLFRGTKHTNCSKGVVWRLRVGRGYIHM